MPKDLKKWETIRQKGKQRFILITGVLSYGLPMFAIVTFYVNRRPDRPLTLVMIAVSAVIWAFAGALFGWIMWKLTERKYQKFLARNSG